MSKQKWVIWSGEGERGTKEIKSATETGIKRIITKERCGDRWAIAATYTGDDYMDSCPMVRERGFQFPDTEKHGWMPELVGGEWIKEDKE